MQKALVIIDSTPKQNKLLAELVGVHARSFGADFRVIAAQSQLGFGLEWQYVDPSGSLKKLAGRHNESVAKFLEAVYREIRLPYLNEQIEDRPVVLVSVGNWLRKAANLAESVQHDYPDRCVNFVYALRYVLNRTIGITPALYFLDEPDSLKTWLQQGLALFPHEDLVFGRYSIVLNGSPSGGAEELVRKAIADAISAHQHARLI